MSIEKPYPFALEELHHALLSKENANESTQTLGLPKERLGIYQGFIRGHILNILDKIYTDLPKLFAPEIWQNIKQTYFQSVPAAHYELNHAAKGLPEFLVSASASREHWQLQPWHVELAQLEWAEYAAYSANNVDYANTPTGYALNHTLEIFQCDYASGTLLKNLRLGNLQSLPPPQQQEIVFVYRHPNTLKHRLLIAQPAELFVFKMVAEQVPLHEAATAAGISPKQAEQLVEQALHAGFILDLQSTVASDEGARI